MGIIIKEHELCLFDRTRLQKPLIFCNPSKELEEKAISLNVPLAKKLVDIKFKRRALRMEQCLQQILGTLPEDTVVKDFDVMFNPDYEVDVLRIMISLNKRKPFDIIWPGKYEDGKIIYAEEDYRDYKVFRIDEYDVTCVI